MRTIKLGFLAATMLLALNSLQADEPASNEARAIIDRAIKAHGGKEQLAKRKAIHVKSTGTLDFMNNIKFAGDTYSQLSDKFKHVIDVEINGKNVTVTQVFDGKKFWINVLGKTQELKDEKILKELKENMYLDGLGNLIGLDARDITLSLLGEVKVNGAPAAGVRASSKGHRDANLFFDKKTGLLAKTEWRAFDATSNQEVSQEKVYSDYKEVNGVQSPYRIIIEQDGKRHISLEITTVEFVERLEDSVFAEP